MVERWKSTENCRECCFWGPVEDGNLGCKLTNSPQERVTCLRNGPFMRTPRNLGQLRQFAEALERRWMPEGKDLTLVAVNGEAS